MTTDVYPRENCIAPAIVFIVWTTDTERMDVDSSPGLRPHSGYPPSEERGVAHRGDAGEMGVGRDGRGSTEGGGLSPSGPEGPCGCRRGVGSDFSQSPAGPTP